MSLILRGSEPRELGRRGFLASLAAGAASLIVPGTAPPPDHDWDAERGLWLPRVRRVYSFGGLEPSSMNWQAGLVLGLPMAALILFGVSGYVQKVAAP